jgi:hypothetical protein
LKDLPRKLSAADPPEVQMRSSRIAVFALALLVVGDAAVAQEGPDREVRGTVVSAETGEAVEGAWITFGYGDVGTYSRRDGAFSLPGAPSFSGEYEVRALGYEEAPARLAPGVEDQVVALTPDPSELAALGRVLSAFKARTNRSHSVRIFEGEQLALAPDVTVLELLERRGIGEPTTICLDDAPGGEIAIEWAPHELYRVESLLDGRVVRLYTQTYIERLLTRGERLGVEVTFPHRCV